MYQKVLVLILLSFLCIVTSLSLRNKFNVDRLTSTSIIDYNQENLTIVLEKNDSIGNFNDEFELRVHGVSNKSYEIDRTAEVRHRISMKNAKNRNVILSHVSKPQKRSFFGLIIIPCKHLMNFFKNSILVNLIAYFSME